MMQGLTDAPKVISKSTTTTALTQPIKRKTYMEKVSFSRTSKKMGRVGRDGPSRYTFRRPVEDPQWSRDNILVHQFFRTAMEAQSTSSKVAKASATAGIALSSLAAVTVATAPAIALQLLCLASNGSVLHYWRSQEDTVTGMSQEKIAAYKNNPEIQKMLAAMLRKKSQ